MREFFLDESGELGFSVGSSKKFLIAIIEAKQPKRLKNALRKEKKRLHDLGWPRDIEIKGTSLFRSHLNDQIPSEISDHREENLQRIIRRILSCDTHPNYICVEKDRLSENLRTAPYGIAYNFFAARLFCKLAEKYPEDGLQLIVDQRNKETHAHMPFDGYLQTKVIADNAHAAGFTISHENSEKWLGLQAVDFISWGMFRHFEHGDDQFCKIIYPHCSITDHFYKSPPKKAGFFVLRP